jgi:hypothetical protein
VLITNALIYSTTDIFSAGFQDHGIGPILGTHGNTGAGGANVWDYMYLEQAMPDTFQSLPKGTSMRVAFRRSTRIGSMSGVPLEDLGVVPDKIHRMTKDDLFKDNVDLIAHAASLLKGNKLRILNATATTSGANRKLSLTTQGVSRVDVYLNGRPSMSLDVKNGSTQTALPASPAALKTIRLEGYEGGDVVVTRNLIVTS